MDTRVPRYAHGRRSCIGVGKGHCQRQRFCAAAGHDATSMKDMNMSSSMHVKFFTWRMFSFMELIDAFLTGLGARGNHCMWNLDVSCVFGEVVIEFTTCFGKYRSRHTQSHLTNVTVVCTWTQIYSSQPRINRVVTLYSIFNCSHSAPESFSNYDAESKPCSGRLAK